MKEKKITFQKARNFHSFTGETLLREIHYELKGKEYFAIDFQNNSSGDELR